MNDLRIGQRIYDELKRQGRSVTWLAKQLGMERTSLYYIFRQNSIDVELLLRISAFIGHNFIQDLDNVYKSYGL
ncbi:MAG: XRE family transcriptional regulator [bacterium]|nr:XRE family transcriptional regulator [Candidatus Limimorpha equi]